MANAPEKIDYFDPSFVASVVIAIFRDTITLLALFFIAIPLIGLAIYPMLMVTIIPMGIMVGFILIPKIKHVVPRIVLLFTIITPLPVLTIGIIISILTQNRIFEAMVVEAAIDTAATVAAALTAEVGGAGGAVVEGSGRAAEISTKAERVGEGIKKVVESGVDVAHRIDENEDATNEALGEEPFLFDKLQREAFAAPDAANDNEKNVTLRNDDTVDLAA